MVLQRIIASISMCYMKLLQLDGSSAHVQSLNGMRRNTIYLIKPLAPIVNVSQKVVIQTF